MRIVAERDPFIPESLLMPTASRSTLAFLFAAALAPACSSSTTTADGLGTSDDDLRKGVVRLYTDKAFGGELTSLAVGDHDLVATPWDNAAQSIRIFGDYTVELFLDGAYGGKSILVTADTPDLGAFDGKVSSLRIHATGGAGGTPTPAPPPTGSPTPAPTPPPAGNPPPPNAAGPSGWASVAGLGLSGTTGGAGGPTVSVTSAQEFNTAAAGTAPATIQVSAALKGVFDIGSNKTIVGMGGGSLTGHVQMDGSVNVIVRNLTVVGYNCTDNPDCQSGADAITVTRNAHHLWFDHDDISNGSDGNLDITHASDYVTISWTKFSYSGTRPGGHQFSSLIGHTDVNPEDIGHLKVTLHHDWWADNVGERMPRVRYGQVHSYNNLFTAEGNNYCIRAGAHSLILSENNAFIGVSTPFDLDGGDVLSRGDLFDKATGNTTGTGKAFTPPYAYALDAVGTVAAAVRAGAGTK